MSEVVVKHKRSGRTVVYKSHEFRRVEEKRDYVTMWMLDGRPVVWARVRFSIQVRGDTQLTML